LETGGIASEKHNYREPFLFSLSCRLTQDRKLDDDKRRKKKTLYAKLKKEEEERELEWAKKYRDRVSVQWTE